MGRLRWEQCLFLFIGVVGAVAGEPPLETSLTEVSVPLYQEPLRPQFHFTARQWSVNKLNPVIRPEPPHGGEEGW